MFETQEQKDNYERARELRNKVENWVNREFNFINVEIYEKLSDGCLFEHIRPINFEEYSEMYAESLSEDDLADLIEEVLEMGERDTDAYIIAERENEVREFISDNSYDCDHYPMWSTLFEFKSEPPESWLEAAEQVGLGVIENSVSDHLNSTLFASSAGHSFYSSYWIPLYLKIFEYERKNHANIDFSMV